ncbi:carbohydrate kinase [Nonlabens sp. YIK11]|uniref:bifunctional ADP-dependent NAD(P)H-hydrate dehydratase/NAD(P)H-hydrate epimerase n=1 Tax=Nonlabens sp. YIK11 TaxID=1453349 RepID=UPI0006DC4AA1|nr:bifunctional ADP-dependent NAD(P)H-hydrate dehydratase/NAD(P)H-hydrate epimerase [Nonlabens sp. YIK11]KQC34015.1 carbohydrate kinase [Nonlabens sp. YIK11]
MKILTAAQLAEADQATLKSQNISSIDLMERVSTLVFNKIHERLNGAPVQVKIFCGIGNNGGDGLAIARHMIQHGYHVTTYVTNCSKKRSKDFLVNYDKIKEVTKDWPILLDCEEDIPEISPEDIVIDAIFGIGLNRPVQGWMASLFNRINDSGAFTVSIDMPSGLFSDTAQPADSAVIQADHTFTFNSPKLSFFLKDTGNYTGTFEVLNIGLDPTFIHQADPAAMLITSESAQNIYRPRKKFSHKGDYGHVLVMAGSKGKIGAALLAATAAINSGAGKVTAYVPSCGNDILQSSVPEVMTIADSGMDQLNDFKTDLEKYTLCIGPGIGTSDEVVSAFAKAIKLQSSPVLIDADGINILAANSELLKDVPAKSILTPHDGELERLLGSWDSSMERLDKAREFSKQHDVILVLKGAHSITIYKNHMYINYSGNAGMATAGSGDVLSGIISSLMAQSYDPLMAAVFGTYIHGASGDIAAQTYAHEGLRAGIISNFVGPAILQLFRQEKQQQ